MIKKIGKNKISTAVTFFFHISSFNGEVFGPQSLTFKPWYLWYLKFPIPRRHLNRAPLIALDSTLFNLSPTSNNILGSSLFRVICLENIARGGAF